MSAANNSAAPSAFPITAEQSLNGISPDGGMTLRDYFAAKAMQGAAASNVVYSSEIAAARDAYAMADAMLKARQQ